MKADPYEVLGVRREADSEVIKRAYRRLVLAFHPDTGDEPSADRFRAVREAYETLGDPARRRLYDRRTARQRLERTRSHAVAPPISRPAPLMSVRPAFSPTAPFEDLFDRLTSDFFGIDPMETAPTRRLRMEIVLSPQEARTGGRLPIDHPMLGERIWLDIAPGVRGGERRQAEIAGVGAKYLLLDIRLKVA